MIHLELYPHSVVTSVMLDSGTPKEDADMYRAYLTRDPGYRGHVARSMLCDLPKGLGVDLSACCRVPRTRND